MAAPNALLTFAEYLEDYAPEPTRLKGWELITRQVAEMEDEKMRARTDNLLAQIRSGERDMLL